MTAEEMIEAVKDNQGEDDLGTSLSVPQTHRPLSKRVFMAAPRTPGRMVHITENGVCLHDFSMEPCTWFLNCLTCAEHECEKRDAARGQEMRDELSLAEEMLADATEADEESIVDADRWVDAKIREVVVLQGIAAVYDDDTIPYGSRFRLAPEKLELAVSADRALIGRRD